MPDYKKRPISNFIFTPVFKNKDITSLLRKSVYFLFLLYTFFPYFYGEKDRYPLIFAGLLFAIYLHVLKSAKNQDNQKNLFQLDKMFSIYSIVIVLGVMFLIIFIHYFSSFIMISFFNIETSIQLKDISEILTRLFGTCAVLIAAFIGWQRVEVHRSGQVTDGFIRANEQLGAVTSQGKPQIETRLGGIYALEKIAKENKENYFCVVINILTAYVRENSPCIEIDNDNPEHKENNKKMRTDISAIIEILRKTDFSFYHENNNIINLSGSYMPNTVFNEADLSWAYLSKANLSKANLSESKLFEADLSGADLTEANLTEANLTEANLTEVNLSGADLSGANLTEANLSGADLSGADLSGANLSEANLTEANLSGADLSGANLSGTELSEADLSWADLSGANLTGANLTGANLTGANLTGANLSGADLSGADLTEANLSGADLSEADLSEADLSEANLSGAELSEADLSKSKKLTQNQIDSAFGNQYTELPQGIKIPDRWLEKD